MKAAPLAIKHFIPGRGVVPGWAWTDKPNARDLKDFGGRCEVRPVPGSMPYNVPIGYGVIEGPDPEMEPWRIQVMRIVGSLGASESWETIDTASTFRAALVEAKRLCRAAIAKASRR